MASTSSSPGKQSRNETGDSPALRPDFLPPAPATIPVAAGHPPGVRQNPRRNTRNLINGLLIGVVILACIAAVTIVRANSGRVDSSAVSTIPATETDAAAAVAGSFYVADQNGYVERVGVSGILSIIAGVSVFLPPVSKPALNTSMRPGGLAIDDTGNVYVADQGGHVFKVTPDGELSIIAGTGLGGGAFPKRDVPQPATSVSIFPNDVAVDSAGNFYLVDNWQYLDKITPDGALTVIGGSSCGSLSVTAPALNGQICPAGVDVDKAGNLYVADQYGFIEKLTPDGTFSVVAGNGVFYNTAPVAGPARNSPMNPYGVTVDGAGNVYIADVNGYIEKVTPDGELSVIAGNGDHQGAPVAGPAVSSPMSPFGVAVNAAGVVFIADGNGYVEQVTTDGRLSVVAGNGSDRWVYGPKQGLATGSPIRPWGVAVSR